MDEPSAKSEPLVILQVSTTDPTRRLHLWLGDRATPFTLVILLVSLCGTPRQIYHLGSDVGPSPEADLSCGDPVSDRAFFRRVYRPAESANLAEEGM